MAAVAYYPWRPLGELLVEKALLNVDELEAALAEQRRSGRLLGELLVEKQLISPEQLTCVLAEQYGVQLEVVETSEQPGDPASAAPAETLQPRPLGRLLLERGLVTQEELDFALEVQRSTGRRLGEILVDHAAVSWIAVAAAVAEQHGVERVDVRALRAVPTPAPPLPQPAPAPAAAPMYEVRAGVAALYRSDSFLEATDFAFEQLESEPSELRIMRVSAGREEAVWTYSAAAAEANESSPDLVHQFGFDVTRWTGPPRN